MSAPTSTLRFDVDSDWQEIASRWTIRPDTVYLNHGSFGLAPDVVREARAAWIRQLNEQPMDFFVRQLEPHVERVLNRLGQFVGTGRDNLVFVDNATYGMNVVANSFPLNRGDEVLLNDHEYGAVHRIWQRRCSQVGAAYVEAALPRRFESAEQIIDCLFARVTENTRLIVISHITSPTALIMPVAEIVRRAKAQGIATCIDGPHALAQIDVQIDALGCDFYTASCHKWLCATLGSGFLYAAPRWHEYMEPLNKSWGRLLPAMPQHWTEEFTWSGTRDISAFLSIETAIDFMEGIGIRLFQERSHYLARYCRERLESEFKTVAIAPDQPGWYGSMTQVPLPKSEKPLETLQTRIWNRHSIEVPVVELNGDWFIRVSHHLYNSKKQVDLLAAAVTSELS